MSVEGQESPTLYTPVPRRRFLRDAFVSIVGGAIVFNGLERAGIIQKTPVEKLLNSTDYLSSPVLKTKMPYAAVVGTWNAGDSDAAGTRAVSAISIIAHDVDSIDGDWSDIIPTATAGKTLDHLVTVQLQDPRILEMRDKHQNRQIFLSAMQNDMGRSIIGDRESQESLRFLQSAKDAFRMYLDDPKSEALEVLQVGYHLERLANRLDASFSENIKRLEIAIELMFNIFNPQALTLLGFLPIEYAKFIEFIPDDTSKPMLKVPVEGDPFAKFFAKHFVDWANTELVRLVEKLQRKHPNRHILFVPVSKILDENNFPFADEHTDKFGQTKIAQHVETRTDDDGTSLFDRVHHRTR